jgi:class 3 adenylate cyclase/tetratricopeptide (TPR) repeat protein
MRCQNCDHETPDQGQFCESCGVQIIATCRACGGNNRPTARFCIECGTFLLSESFSEPTETVGDARERTLRSRHGLLGARKHITVLFGDTKGSLERIQGLDPEEAAKWLQIVLKTMSDAVHRHEGTVSRLQGDGIMALFGAPLAQEDHALRACFAAVEMLNEAKLISGNLSEIRVGLHSGEAVVRSISDDLGMHYDAVGVTVHLAARMEQIAAPGSICMTRDTLRHVQDFVTAEELGSTPVRGMHAPVDVFRLTGMRPIAARWLAGTFRALTPFVGRDDELAQLLVAIERVRGGEGGLVAVVGEPGAGKSRLLHEFVRSSSPRDVVLLTAGAATYGRNAPYLPITRLLRANFEIADRDTPHEVAKKLLGGLASIDKSLLKAALPVLYGLLDLSIDRGWRELDLTQRRRKIIDTFEMLLLALARIKPVVLIVEDLQWIDAETQTILREILGKLVASRVLFILTYRPEYVDTWVRSDFCRTLTLRPLNQGAARTMLGQLLGDRLALEQIKRLLVERSGGNPLFIEESVRSLVEAGALGGSTGGHWLAPDIRDITVPASVTAVLAARIDRLKPDLRGVLEVASVIGRRVPVALLRGVTNLPDDQLTRLLKELQSADFLYQAQATRDQEYVFKHALTRDVAYESLLLESRRSLHSQLAGTIERLYAERLDEHIDSLAEHTFLAELWPAAVGHLLRGCIRAVGSSASRVAVALFERGLAALAHLPEDKSKVKAGVDLRLVVVNALIPLGEHADIIRLLKEAETLANLLGDPRRLALVYNQLTVAYWMSGEHLRALEAGEQALAAADRLGHPHAQLGARFALGMVHHALGNLSQVVTIERSLLANLDGKMDRQQFGWVGYPGTLIRTFLAGALIERGDFAEAEMHLDAGCRLANELGHAYSQTMIYAIVGQLQLERGELSFASSLLEEMLALCQKEEVWAMYPVIAARLVTAYTRQGRTADALAILNDALEPSIYRKGATYTWFYLFLAAGEAYLSAGRQSDARDYVDRAKALAQKNDEEAHLASALKLQGDVIIAESVARDTAVQSYLDAIALAEPRGMRPLLARAHFALGSYLSAHQRGQGKEHLAIATELHQELGLTFPSVASEAPQQKSVLQQ